MKGKELIDKLRYYLSKVVKSKFNFYFYFNAGFVAVTFCLIVYWTTTPHFAKTTRDNTFPPFLGVLITISLLAYLAFLLYKKAFIIKVYENQIQINRLGQKKIISKSDIEKIDLFKRANFYNLVGVNSVTTVIYLKNNEIIIVPEALYRNYFEVKKSIFENFALEIVSYNENPLYKKTDSNIEKKIFSGNPLLSTNTVVLILFSLCLIYLDFFFRGSKIQVKGYSLVAILTYYLGTSTQMFYFIIEKELLIIKNHYLPWYKRVVSIESIKIVSFDAPHRRSYALRVITNDFKSKTYSAGSLSNKKWTELKECFENVGIEVK